MEKRTIAKIDLSLKDTWHFQRLLEILSSVLVNDKVPREVREELFAEINRTFETE